MTKLIVSTRDKFMELMKAKDGEGDVLGWNQTQMTFQVKSGDPATTGDIYVWAPSHERTRGFTRDTEVHVYPSSKVELSPEQIMDIRARFDNVGVHYAH